MSFDIFFKKDQEREQRNQAFDEVFFKVLVLVVGALVIPTVGLVVLLSGLVGYFLYWSWEFKLEDSLWRRILRTVLVYATLRGFLELLFLGAFSYFGNEIGQGFNWVLKSLGKPVLYRDEVKAVFIGFTVELPAVFGVVCALGMKFFEKELPTEPYRTMRYWAIRSIMPLAQVLARFKLSSIPGCLGFVLVLAFINFTLYNLFNQIFSARVLQELLGAFTIWTIYVCFFRFTTDHLEAKRPEQVADSNTAKIKEGSIVLGQLFKPRKNLMLTWRDINHHIHVLGQPGSGKSVLLRNFYAYQVLSGEGLLMIDLKADLDVKGEIVSLFESRKEMHKEPGHLRILDISRPEKSSGYNPLLRGSASELKDKIIGSMEWSEPYYQKIAERFVLTIMRAFVEVRDAKGVIFHLGDLLEAISQRKALEILSEEVSDLRLKEDLRTLSRELKEKEKSLSGLRADLEAIINSEFSEIFLKREPIDLLDVILKGDVFYAVLDSQAYPVQTQRIGRMLLSDLRAASGEIVSRIAKEQRPKTALIIDEFSELVSNFETGKLFTGFLNKCRGSGIGVIIAHQSLGDFEDERLKKQVLDSTETLITFVQKDPETCETLSNIIGTEETYKKTEAMEQGIFIEGPTGFGSRREVHEFIVHPNEFKNLNVGEAVYIAKKPSRHGKFRVNFLEIEKNFTEINEVRDLSEGEFFDLNLRTRLKKQQSPPLKKKKASSKAQRETPIQEGEDDLDLIT